MSDVLKTFFLVILLGTAVFLNYKITSQDNQSKLHRVIQTQSSINQSLESKILDLSAQIEYLEFSLEVNNKMIEEILMEQIQKKGDAETPPSKSN